MYIKSRYLVLISIFLLPSSVFSEVIPEDLIRVQLTEQAMKIGIESSLRDGCIQSGKSTHICKSEMKIVDKIDINEILIKVYLEIYTIDQMEALCEFYSFSVGKKYSKGILSILARDVNYEEQFPMPNISASEDRAIREFQNSAPSRIEKDVQPKMKLSINKYLVPALQEATAAK